VTRVTQHVQRCYDRISESIATLDEGVAQSLVHPKENLASVVQEAAQIRDYVRNLPQKERMGFIHDAIERGERNVVAAVVGREGGPSPWISGLTPDEQRTLRGLAAQAMAPAASKQLEALRHVQA
jgi:hypothetical protein